MSAPTLDEIKQQVMQLTAEDREALANFLADETKVSAEDGNRDGARLFSRDMEWIRQNRNSYRGRFVALKNGRLVASGTSERDVWQAATRAGVSGPFLAYIETNAEETFGGW
jgi:hypothetical protein